MQGFIYKGNGLIRVARRVARHAGVGGPLGFRVRVQIRVWTKVRVWVRIRLRLGVGLVLGLKTSRDDSDDHFRRLQPIDLNLDLLGITHLDYDSRVHHSISVK